MNTPAPVSSVPASLRRLLNDSRVSKVGAEGEDGYYVMLKPGFADHKFDQNCHTIHEWKVKDVLRRVKDISSCTCKECREALATSAVSA